MIKEVVKSTFFATVKQLKQLKEVRAIFFSNEKLEEYQEDKKIHYRLRIYEGKIKETFLFPLDPMEIETECSEEIIENYKKHIMKSYHILHNETLTKMEVHDYLSTFFTKKEVIYYDVEKIQLIDSRNEFYCDVTWTGKHFQVEPFYTEEFQPYNPKFRKYKKYYEKETALFMKAFHEINNKQKLRKLMNII
jgi:hypothetical protein